MRHTRAIARDRSKRPPAAPPPADVEARLTELIRPLTLGQVAHYHDLGLRERVLSLPVMVALVLSMIWRQVGSANGVQLQLWATWLLYAALVDLTDAIADCCSAWPTRAGSSSSSRHTRRI